MPDYAQRLNLFVEEKRSARFEWGVNDCCLFACDWLILRTGVDPAAELGLRGRYRSALGAARLLRGAGGVERIAIEACVRHGWPEVPVAAARRGDLALIDTEHGPALGVMGCGIAVFPGKNGAVFRRVNECRRAWRIS